MMFSTPPVHVYDGRYYNVPHALVARIDCPTRPTAGTVAAWAGVSGVRDGWQQAGMFTNAGETTGYAENGNPYRLDRVPAVRAVVKITRLPFGFYSISLNGRTVTRRAFGYVWAGVERVDNQPGDGACSVAVTVT